LNALKKPALLLENEHLNFVELTKYTPRYLADYHCITKKVMPQ